MSTRTIIAVLILIGAFIAINYDKKQVVAPTPTPSPVACTMDAMQCPDGSYVGRTGPDCQFICPEVKPTPKPTNPPIIIGTLEGKISVSPTCGGPETLPPNEGCEPRGYQTTISFLGSKKTYETMSDESGKYSISLPAGSYNVHAKGGDIFPICPINETIIVQQDKTVIKNIDCDSGIR
ncbi:MAG: carboxypeptidase regulatory-like domain-containing protein [Candidatus Pacebacteria bacterium]|nr:carboxypeptidase regulatory-like domain-containing protein [Candidatus Paceibacterota bacterium]